MSRKRFTLEQVIHKLRQDEVVTLFRPAAPINI